MINMGKIVHKNRLFKVEKIHVKKDYDVYGVIENNVAVILAFTDKNHILIERQKRYVVNRTIQEIPAGHINGGESVVNAAKRELKEETGYTARSVKVVAKYYPSPGVLSIIEHVCIATGLEKGKTSRDKDEELSVREISIDTALDMIKNGKIIDAKTIIAILYYKNFILK